MGEPGIHYLVVQIFSDVPEVSRNFIINGKNISTTFNAISEAMEYWRRYIITNINNLSAKEDRFMSLSEIEFRNKIKFAKITSINVIEITPV